MLERVQLAVTEACANVVVHAYRDASPASSASRSTSALASCAFACGTMAAASPRARLPGLGLGLPLIGALATSVDIRPATRRARWSRCRSPAATGPRPPRRCGARSRATAKRPDRATPVGRRSRRSRRAARRSRARRRRAGCSADGAGRSAPRRPAMRRPGRPLLRGHVDRAAQHVGEAARQRRAPARGCRAPSSGGTSPGRQTVASSGQAPAVNTRPPGGATAA